MGYCTKCGNAINDNLGYCVSCYNKSFLYDKNKHKAFLGSVIVFIANIVVAIIGFIITLCVGLSLKDNVLNFFLMLILLGFIIDFFIANVVLLIISIVKKRKKVFSILGTIINPILGILDIVLYIILGIASSLGTKADYGSLYNYYYFHARSNIVQDYAEIHSGRDFFDVYVLSEDVVGGTVRRVYILDKNCTDYEQDKFIINNNYNDIYNDVYKKDYFLFYIVDSSVRQKVRIGYIKNGEVIMEILPLNSDGDLCYEIRFGSGAISEAHKPSIYNKLTSSRYML